MKDKELKNAGLKATIPRLKILEILKNSKKHHLSAEDIYSTLKSQNYDVSLATIYRVLTQFEIAGLINRLNFEGEHAFFELNIGEHHDHLVCLKCGKIVEFQDHTIEKKQKEIADKLNFTINNHSLSIYGICKNCKNLNKFYANKTDI